MKQSDFYKMLISLGAKPDGENFIFTRDQLAEFMRGRGYAERTISNHTQPSRDGGIIKNMIETGVIEPAGHKRWLVPLVSRASKSRRRPLESFLRLFEGSPPPDGQGWVKSARLDDSGAIEWRLYRREIGEGVDSLKVVALGRVPHKANYWLKARNGRLAKTEAALLLQQHQPAIYENLIEVLGDIYALE